MKRLSSFRLITLIVIIIMMLTGIIEAATASYNLVQLANTSVSSDDGQSNEAYTSPSVLLSARSQWQPGYNFTLGGTNPYEVVYDFQATYDIANVKVRTMFRGSQSLSQFFIETSTNGTDWTEFGQWNGYATGGFDYTFTPPTAATARYLRYRVPAGQYTAVDGDHNYGGPGLKWAEIMSTTNTELSVHSPLHSIAYSALGSVVSVTNPPSLNRGSNPAVVNDGLWSTGALGHNATNGWGTDAKLIIDLGGSAFNIASMELLWMGDRGHYFRANNYTLESSIDGVNWNLVSFSIDTSDRGTTADLMIFNEMFLAKYLRLGHLTEPTNTNDPSIGFFEILVFGTEPLPGGTVLLIN